MRYNSFFLITLLVSSTVAQAFLKDPRAFQSQPQSVTAMTQTGTPENAPKVKDVIDNDAKPKIPCECCQNKSSTGEVVQTVAKYVCGAAVAIVACISIFGNKFKW